MKTKRISGVIIAGHPAHLSEPTRRFLRGLLVFMLALGSLIALSARGQTNYTGAYYFNTFAGNAYGATAGRELAIDKDAGAVLRIIDRLIFFGNTGSMPGASSWR